jgi:hypothetical protein
MLVWLVGTQGLSDASLRLMLVWVRVPHGSARPLQLLGLQTQEVARYSAC